MPQFDFSQAMPQVIWLALVFGILYLVVHMLYPRVDRVVQNRKATIAADLAEAEAARAAADAASSGGSSVLADARAEALHITGKARDEAGAQVQQRLAEADRSLAGRADEAAARLAGQRAAAVAELDRAMGEVVVDLVRQVSGLTLAAAEADEAVRKVAA